ncbi:hypothetical protein FM107_08980 [Sphingobacterium sp. JB170]|nr:hypothetical protein FM107_08980 [Sphingobacterium sp. JB170]
MYDGLHVYRVGALNAAVSRVHGVCGRGYRFFQKELKPFRIMGISPAHL